MSTSSARRDLSLDSFRGLTVVLMILVNLQGSPSAAYATMKHADWHGITLADFVFPVFLLIVGLSVPLAFAKSGAGAGWVSALRRAALLFVIGVALGLAIRPTLDPDMIRWAGVLQRIAIVYLACVLVLLLRRGAGLTLCLAALLLVAHSLLLLLGEVAGSGPASLAPGEGLSGWLDRQFLPGRVHHGSWDPEGVFSTLPAIASGLIGMAATQRMRAKVLGNIPMVAIGMAMVVAGAVLTQWLPLNKNLWSASFVLVTSGAGLALWAMLRAIWPMVGRTVAARWTVSVGQAALTLYVVHMLLIAMIVRTLPTGETIWATSWRALAATGLPPGLASMLYAVIGVAISCAVLAVLRRRGWVLKL